MKALFSVLFVVSSFASAQVSSQSKSETVVKCSGHLVARNAKSILVKVVLTRENSLSLGSGQKEMAITVESQSPENQLSLKEIVVSKNSKISIRTIYQTLNMSLSVGKPTKPGNTFPGSLQITQRLRPAGKPQPIGEANLNCK